MKRLIILAIVMAMMVPVSFAGQNQEGKLTVLPYDSEIDPNIFYSFYPAGEPIRSINEDGEYAYLTPVVSLDPNSTIKLAIVAINDNGKLVAYVYWIKGDKHAHAYVLNPEKTKFVKYVKKQDKSGGV